MRNFLLTKKGEKGQYTSKMLEKIKAMGNVLD